MIPKLTIPESSYDASIYTTRKQKSLILIYLIKLTNASGILLTILYLVAYLGVKPLLQTKNERRLDLLNKYRHKLRDMYLRLISIVDHIPIVGFPSHGKVVVDAITQTDNSYVSTTLALTDEEKLDNLDAMDKLGQDKLLCKVSKLSNTLDAIKCYNSHQMHHYKLIRDDVKDFQKLVDTEIFNYDDLYRDGPRNLAIDTRNDIRSIKGLYMSGQI